MYSNSSLSFKIGDTVECYDRHHPTPLWINAVYCGKHNGKHIVRYENYPYKGTIGTHVYIRKYVE